MSFQGFPHRPPVLRGGLRHDFIDPVVGQPVDEATEIDRRSITHARIKQLLGLAGSIAKDFWTFSHTV